MANLATFNQTIRNEKTQAYLTEVLNEKKNSFVASLVSLVSNSTSLQACEPLSVMYAALKAVAVSLPLEPSLGYAAVIPYNDNKSATTLAQFQIMRDGWMELCLRTGKVSRITNEVVFEGELVSYNRFTDDFVFDSTKKVSDKVIGYMAYIRLTNGFEKYVYWDVEKVKKHANTYSLPARKGYGSWKDNFDAMALKTVLKHLIKKYAPKSIEVDQALKFDQSVSRDKSLTPEYIDNPEPREEKVEQMERIKAKAQEVKVRAAKAVKPAEQTPVPAEEDTTEVADEYPDQEALDAAADAFFNSEEWK